MVLFMTPVTVGGTVSHVVLCVCRFDSSLPHIELVGALVNMLRTVPENSKQDMVHLFQMA